MENDQNILESKLEDEIVYFPEPWENYNGVLIVLREPGGGKTGESAETDLAGNRDWFQTIVEDKNLDHLKTQYRNRFCEMLGYLGLSEQQLGNVAFTNLKMTAGGSTVSKEYWDLEKRSALESKLNAIKQADGKTHAVFLLREVFEEIVGDHKTEDAIFYNGNNGKCWKRAAQIGGIWYFEIRHPSRSPRIMIEQSTLPADYKFMAGRKG